MKKLLPAILFSFILGSCTDDLIIQDTKEPDQDTEPLGQNWIAAWEFNDSSSLGYDYTGNNHTAILKEGSITGNSGCAVFDGKSGFMVKLAPELKINEFIIEARIFPTSFGPINNIIAAEPPGSAKSGWILRIINNGELKFYARDVRKRTAWNQWLIDILSLNTWYTIRIERSADSIQFKLNDINMPKVPFDGDISKLEYNWGIGYDAMNQSDHNRYFKGEIDYIRFGRLE